MVKPRRVAVCGLGLVGGSIARALSRAGHSVVGFDRKAVWEEAHSARAVRGPRRGLEQTVEGAEIVFLAAPPLANLELLERLQAPARTIVTDVSSVKVPICALARRLRTPGFIGGHPMAGNAGSGFRASRGTLFEGRTWILTPHRKESPSVKELSALIRSIGARPVLLSAAVHDRVVAFLSHVPQIVSDALLENAQEDPVARKHLGLSGPGFRDMTRLARSPRGLWMQILEENRAEVERALRAFLRVVRSHRRSAI
jgi:prephenate dehydrogenase